MNVELRAEWLLLLRTEPRVRRWLEREVENRRVRARPNWIEPERLEQLEARAARQYERTCVVCGERFTSASGSALTCSAAHRVALHKLRRAGREALAA